MTQKRQTKSTVQTTQTTLSPLEEKVVRMRFGYTAPEHMLLERVGQDNPEIAAKLAEIEERALQAVAPRRSDAKDALVAELKNRSS